MALPPMLNHLKKQLETRAPGEHKSDRKVLLNELHLLDNDVDLKTIIGRDTTFSTGPSDDTCHCCGRPF